MAFYSITDLQRITGLSERSLRNFLKDNILKGEKVNGKWMISKTQIVDFIKNEDVYYSLKTKLKGIVRDCVIDVRNSEGHANIVFLYTSIPNEVLENMEPSVDMLIEETKSEGFYVVYLAMHKTMAVLCRDINAWLKVRIKLRKYYNLD